MSADNAGIIKKIVVTGRIHTASPLLIGSGEDDGHIDIRVLKNRQEEPLIPGTSLAGVFREFIAGVSGSDTARALFGDIQGSNPMQSAIIIDDVILKNASLVIRDGVGIDNITGVARDGAKYDYEVVERGAVGEIYMLVTLRQCHARMGEAENIEKAVQQIANKLMSGVHVGAITAKGFGRIAGSGIRVAAYDFTQPAAVKGWLLGNESGCTVYKAIAENIVSEKDFSLNAEFAINGSLIVRTDHYSIADDFDAVQLRSRDEFVIPGTTVKGIIHKQAEKIFRKMGKDIAVLDELMGISKAEKNSGQVRQKSRLYTEEIYFSESKNVKAAAQSRNRINRFTGGTMDSALFTNQPVWQKDTAPTLKLQLRIEDCRPWEAGLLLFVLRDIWTGVVAFGGEKSVGRGTLRGVRAKIAYEGKSFIIKDNMGSLSVEGDRTVLEEYAGALLRECEVAV